MHVKKLRLLTPGPTPLYPPAVRAMAGADIHHRTADFRELYKRVLANLKHFMGTANDVVLFTASGTGAMEDGRIESVLRGRQGPRRHRRKIRRTLGANHAGIRPRRNGA